MENYREGESFARFLVMIEGPNEGQVYPLQDTVCTLGRSANNTLVIDSPSISRYHTQIRLLPGRAMGATAIVEDMGSTNGTWVNQRQLTGPQRLVSGDIITLADHISFRYEVKDTPLIERPTPGSLSRSKDDSQTYPPPPPPDDQAARQAYPEGVPASPKQPFVQYGAAAQTAPPSQPASAPRRTSTTVVSPPPSAPPAKRSTWTYIIVAILLILICLCLAVAVYLWFAPVTFWEQVFGLFNIPIP